LRFFFKLIISVFLCIYFFSSLRVQFSLSLCSSFVFMYFFISFISYVFARYFCLYVLPYLFRGFFICFISWSFIYLVRYFVSV